YEEAWPPAQDWAEALGSFRPFLSYAELAAMMFDTLTSLYEALSPVLGLGDVDELLRRLATERRGPRKRAPGGGRPRGGARGGAAGQGRGGRWRGARRARRRSGRRC